MGVLIKALGWIGDLDLLEHVQSNLLGFAFVSGSVQQNRFHDLGTNGMHRGETGHRLLENHGDFFASYGADFRPFGIQRGQVKANAIAVPPDFAGNDLPGRGHDPQDRLGGHALATARLPYDSDGCLCTDIKVNAIHRLERSFVKIEVGS